MTRRILLTLADDTTEAECGGCLARDHRWCGAFAGRLNYRSESDDTILRRGECLAAEAQAARIYHVPDESPIVRLQCAWCHAIADDTEPGTSREAVRALRERMERRGWIVANPGNEDDAKTWRDASDYCSIDCAHGVGESAIERQLREVTRG